VRDELRRTWRPGEHFSLIAPTGYGKSYLATRGLLPMWSHTLILDVKGDDDTLRDAGHKRVRTYPSRWDLLTTGEGPARFRVAPGAYSGGQVKVFDDVFRQVWRSGPGNGDATWTMYADEARLLADPKFLGLGRHLDAVWISGRSKGITLVAGTQAPRWVPSSFYEQARYFAIGQIRDTRAVRRLAEIGGDTDMLTAVIPDLAWREWVFVGPGWAVRTKIPRLPAPRSD